MDSGKRYSVVAVVACLMMTLLLITGSCGDGDKSGTGASGTPAPAKTESGASGRGGFTNSIGVEFVKIPAGSFTMGRDKNFEEGDDVETPQHKVTITRDFYLGKYEVTQAQWVAVMGSNPSNFMGRTNPVEQVSWDDVQVFLGKLNQMEPGRGYRLPTEAEWEYACRAGSTTKYAFGDSENELGDYAWCYENSGERAHPVGQKRPNAWGLYDMHGNVWEWCEDWYGTYPSGSVTDPKGSTMGSRRVLRGGSWFDYAQSCRSAFRLVRSPGNRDNSLGLRLCSSK